MIERRRVDGRSVATKTRRCRFFFVPHETRPPVLKGSTSRFHRVTAGFTLFAPSAIQKSAGRGAVIGAYLGERHRRRRRRPRPAGDRARAERTCRFGDAWRTRSAWGRLANSRMRVGRRRAGFRILAVVTGTHRRRLLLDPRVELALLVFEHLHQVTHRDRVCPLTRRVSGCGETRMARRFGEKGAHVSVSLFRRAKSILCQGFSTSERVSGRRFDRRKTVENTREVPTSRGALHGHPARARGAARVVVVASSSSSPRVVVAASRRRLRLASSSSPSGPHGESRVSEFDVTPAILHGHGAPFPAPALRARAVVAPAEYPPRAGAWSARRRRARGARAARGGWCSRPRAARSLRGGRGPNPRPPASAATAGGSTRALKEVHRRGRAGGAFVAAPRARVRARRSPVRIAREAGPWRTPRFDVSVVFLYRTQRRQDAAARAARDDAFFKTRRTGGGIRTDAERYTRARGDTYSAAKAHPTTVAMMIGVLLRC